MFMKSRTMSEALSITALIELRIVSIDTACDPGAQMR